MSVRVAADPVAAALAADEVLALVVAAALLLVALLVVALADGLLEALELADVVAAALLADELGALLTEAEPVVALPDVPAVPAAWPPQAASRLTMATPPAPTAPRRKARRASPCCGLLSSWRPSFDDTQYLLYHTLLIEIVRCRLCHARSVVSSSRPSCAAKRCKKYASQAAP